MITCVLSVSSFFFGQNQLEKVSAKEKEIVQVRSTFQKEDKAFKELEKALSVVENVEHNIQPDIVSDMYLKMMYFLRKESSNFNVNIMNIRQGNGKGQINGDLKSSALPFAELPVLKHMPMTISGSFKDYQQMKLFIQKIKKGPVAINSIRIMKDQFNIVIDLYGI